MRFHVLLSLCLLLASRTVSVAQSVSPAAEQPKASPVAAAHDAADSYKLVWSDEFNTDGPPNPKNWGFEWGFVRNEELQFYQPENARCVGGLLVIEARRERVANPRYREGARGWQQSRQFAEFTSACLVTRRLHEWLYGRFEMRARIDTRPGLWPAWWTLGTARGWPACGEIDIMEYYQGDLLANTAWLGSGTSRQRTSWDATHKPIREFSDPEWSQKFHVWRMDWDESIHQALCRRRTAQRDRPLADGQRQPRRGEPLPRTPLDAPQPGHRRHPRRRPLGDRVSGAV